MEAKERNNALRRAVYHRQKFQPPAEITTPVEESIEAYKARLAELQAENEQLSSQMKRAQAVTREKQKLLQQLNARLLQEEQTGKALKKAVDVETARQKHAVFLQKRAIVNGERK